ncbi:two component transcriptional regulator winged helix family [Patulibacter medicamentivorans]|uniref:Two component transcriptional regulator winged helix family n=1 Tax=Patulibacter medicamentivorans TaxID=1097667 RepID=H0E479_9ACTN|nr:response regulator transcription factor [Patulibacter medicamentivorans]EHN11521.1 two component transcriptional regulator winged helix family [Patulibacter medicamentivorans]
MAVRVLIADDDLAVLRMLERTLRAEGYDVATAPDGGAALVAVERALPDVIVLDVAMPGLDGLEVCRRLRAKGLGIPVLLLTARDAIDDRVTGLDAGADDYLVKPFATSELLARVRALGRRGPATAAGALPAAAGIVLDPDARTATRDGRQIALTARESALLELLLRVGPRGVLTRERAISEIWADGAVENVVDRYVGYLRRKLGEPPVIRTVRGSGFSLRS